MYNFKESSNRRIPGGAKAKKKLSKAEMQIALRKKKQCDAKAIAIVEQLLEHNVDSNWLLENLQYLCRSHMEDAIEERAISKVCGYVLCDNRITRIIRQRFHINAKTNKVYDVSHLKNYCSSNCYSSAKYLMEQMLTSPLWLRDGEESPEYQLSSLSCHSTSRKSIPGEEIDLSGIYLDLKVDNNIEGHTKKQSDRGTPMEEHGIEKEEVIDGTSKILKEETLKPLIEEFSKLLKEETSKPLKEESSKLLKEESFKPLKEVTPSPLKDSSRPLKKVSFLPPKQIQRVVESSFNTDMNCMENVNLDSVETDRCRKRPCRMPVSSKDACASDNQSELTQENVMEEATELSEPRKVRRKHDADKTSSSAHSKRIKNKEKRNSEQISDGIHLLIAHIEQCFKEWITEETCHLLLGEEAVKYRVLETVEREHKYMALCKKLNRLQIEEEMEEQESLGKVPLKPVPDFSALQEEGKKMEVKVRAFFTGQTHIESSGMMPNGSVEKNNDESDNVLPFLEAHAPKALRRRIFLDKLNRIFPDLLHALCGGEFILSRLQANEGKGAVTIKALVSTFSLSASNITFKTAEWTLVGLVIIKMMSLAHPDLKFLLTTKRASMYNSMILMSYKLEPNYLDRLVEFLMNIPPSSD